ncbi:hypothetical protein TNCV_3377131 [Trichonephila clavipes]|nr:hypothetical protein TNCV_3377131 [Trichonephila clavipes]
MWSDIILLKNKGLGTVKGTVAQQFSEYRQRTAVLFNCASNVDQKSPAVKRNDAPDHNSWLRACVTCNSEKRIALPSWASPDTFSMIVTIQLEAGSSLNTIRPHSASFQPD